MLKNISIFEKWTFKLIENRDRLVAWFRCSYFIRLGRRTGHDGEHEGECEEQQPDGQHRVLRQPAVLLHRRNGP